MFYHLKARRCVIQPTVNILPCFMIVLMDESHEQRLITKGHIVLFKSSLYHSTLVIYVALYKEV